MAWTHVLSHPQSVPLLVIEYDYDASNALPTDFTPLCTTLSRERCDPHADSSFVFSCGVKSLCRDTVFALCSETTETTLVASRTVVFLVSATRNEALSRNGLPSWSLRSHKQYADLMNPKHWDVLTIFICFSFRLFQSITSWPRGAANAFQTVTVTALAREEAAETVETSMALRKQIFGGAYSKLFKALLL